MKKIDNAPNTVYLSNNLDVKEYERIYFRRLRGKNNKINARYTNHYHGWRVGSRFWPMSTPDYPKQFIDAMGVGRSLIQLTIDRLKPICSVTLVINTSEYQRVLSKALSYTSDKNAIVTIGIKPSRPETGYGYIAAAWARTSDCMNASIVWFMQPMKATWWFKDWMAIS